MKTGRWLLLACAIMLAALGVVFVSDASHAASTPGDPVHGQYIFAVAAGCGCHGPNLAGYKAGGPTELPASAPFGELFSGPFGSVSASNITPDTATGVGNWTDDQLVSAIRDGIDDQGHPLYPIMPYMSYHFMSDSDVRDLVAYLRTVAPVSNAVPASKLNGPVPAAPSLPPAPATAPTSGLDRGKYLALAVGDCGSCHTPKTSQGAPDTSKLLAGSALAVGNQFVNVPNITPDKTTGIGNWTAQQIAVSLKTGVLPDGSQEKSLMAVIVNGGLNKLTDADAAAIATYLQSVPAVSNVPSAPQSLPTTGGPSTAMALVAAIGLALVLLSAGLWRRQA
jgi:mono/diheme cytochrome c family protein